MNKATTKFYQHKITKHVAMTPPSVRMVVVEAWAFRVENASADEDFEIGHDIFPVLAIETSIRDRYVKKVPRDSYPDGEQNHIEMLREGWYFSETQVERELVIWTDEMGLVDPDFAASDNAVQAVVVCPWPYSEDQERLAPTVTQVRASAREKFLRSDAARPKQAETSEAKTGA